MAKQFRCLLTIPFLPPSCFHHAFFIQLTPMKDGVTTTINMPPAGAFLVKSFYGSVGRTSISCFCFGINLPWYLLKESNKQVDHDDVLHKEVDSLEEWREEGARRTVFIGFTDWKWRTYRAWLEWKLEQSTAMACASLLPQKNRMVLTTFTEIHY